MKLEGEIGEIHLIERLVELGRETFTGAIRFENDGIIKIIYFKTGDILSASTNDRADSIDEILMRAGKVSREHVKQALAKRKESETLGDALLNLGFITRKELTWARRVQVVGVIRSIAAWTEGSFTIVADYLPKREEGTLFPLPQILVELIVTDADRAKFDRALDGGTAIFDKSPDFEERYRRLGLNQDADTIVAEVDGTRSASDVAMMSGKDAFNVYKLIHALALLGLLERRTAPAVSPVPAFTGEDDFASIGVSDASEAWSMGTPSFDLQDAPVAPAARIVPPTVEMPAVSFDSSDETPAYDETPSYDAAPAWTPEPEPPAKPHSAWDDDDEPVMAPAPLPAEVRMPSWDAPSSAAAIPPMAPPPAQPEPQWGFDEAQIETARRAAVPLASVGNYDDDAPVAAPAPPAKKKLHKEPKSRFGLIIALLVVGILAAGGYGGFLWWQKQQEPVAEVAVARPRPRPPAPVPPVTMTEPSTVTITPTATVATAPPPPQPMTVAATPAPRPTPPPAPTPVPAVRPTPPPPVRPAPATTTTVTMSQTTTGGVVISNSTTPRPAASSALPAADADPKRGSYEEMARLYARNPQGNFTVQFEIVCQAANLTKAIRAGGDKVWFVPITIRERPCFRVFWGRYDTRGAAERGAGEIPQALRGSKPAVVTVPKS